VVELDEDAAPGKRVLSFKVVGVGGSGCSTVERMRECQSCDLIGIHTDAKSLLSRRIPFKVLIGLNVTRGRSTGNDFHLGQRAASDDEEKITSAIGEPNIVFIIAGIGGGTGAGASPTVAKIAKKSGATVIAFINVPFTAEGRICRENAEKSIERLMPFCDLIILIENDRFLKTVPDLSITEAFTRVNHMLLESVQAMVKLVESAGIDNILPLLSGYAVLGYGFGPTIGKSVNAALESPLIGADIVKSKGVMISFKTNAIESDELATALDDIIGKTNNSAPLLWTNTSRGEGEGVEAILLFSGVNPTFIGKP
jgi:cell division protein FtsZ